MLKRIIIRSGIIGTFSLLTLTGFLVVFNTDFFAAGFVLLIVSILALVAAIIYIIMDIIQPFWIKRVLKNGREATALLIRGSDFPTLDKSDLPDEEADIWEEFPVEVQPSGEPPFTAMMKCRVFRSSKLQTGMVLKVRYDPSDKSRVVLAENDQKINRSKRKK